jgi:hypothetical protein
MTPEQRKEVDRDLVKTLAAIIINHNEITQTSVLSQIISTTAYRHFIEYVRKSVLRLDPTMLGRVASVGEGKDVDLYGMVWHQKKPDPKKKPDDQKTQKRPPTTLCAVNGSSERWIDGSWSGFSALQHLAASAIIADICDQLEIVADECAPEEPGDRARHLAN